MNTQGQRKSPTKMIIWFAPLCPFWTIWKERNSKAFNSKEHSVQGIKLSFLCNLWAWSKLFIALSPSSTVDFVDWMGSCWEGSFFVVPLCFWVTLLGAHCLLFVYFGVLFWYFFLSIYVFLYPSKKWFAPWLGNYQGLGT